MKKRHVFAFYCTLLVPVGTLAGNAAGRAMGAPVGLTVAGVVLGAAASYLVLRTTAPGEMP